MDTPENEPIEIGLHELAGRDFSQLSEEDTLWILDSDFPEANITRQGDVVIGEVTEHIYTKFWIHKYHAMVFAEAVVRAVKRLGVEGHPLSMPSIENDDEPHIFIRWRISLPSTSTADALIKSVKAADELVWERANFILDHSDSVLLLGKDTGESLQLLKDIQAELESLGYYVYIIKEQPGKLGESIIQKVLRFALSSKFIVIENSEPSGHLYEIPHVTKMAECITALLQQEGKGATWMFEDVYAKSQNCKKFTYEPADLNNAVGAATQWAEDFSKQFASYQKKTLPWLA
ncbi:MAG: hypothetical protein R3F19_25725 [Verrucomicrobiales bacterium]